MDSDRFAARLAAAKREMAFYRNHNSQFDRLCMDDFEVEDDGQSDLPCPYCYEDHEFTSLCSHLEEEHSFESRVAVCPICSSKVARDMLSHITLQHAHLIKMQRRRRLRRVGIPNSQTMSLLGRDLREAHLQVLLGGSGYRSTNTNPPSNAPTDSLLSSLIVNFPSSEVDEISKSIASHSEDTTLKKATPVKSWKPSFDPSLSLEEREKKIEEDKKSLNKPGLFNICLCRPCLPTSLVWKIGPKKGKPCLTRKKLEGGRASRGNHSLCSLEGLKKKSDAQSEEVITMEKLIAEAYSAIDKAVKAGSLHRSTKKIKACS